MKQYEKRLQLLEGFTAFRYSGPNEMIDYNEQSSSKQHAAQIKKFKSLRLVAAIFSSLPGMRESNHFVVAVAGQWLVLCTV